MRQRTENLTWYRVSIGDKKIGLFRLDDHKLSSWLRLESEIPPDEIRIRPAIMAGELRVIPVYGFDSCISLLRSIPYNMIYALDLEDEELDQEVSLTAVNTGALKTWRYDVGGAHLVMRAETRELAAEIFGIDDQEGCRVTDYVDDEGDSMARRNDGTLYIWTDAAEHWIPCHNSHGSRVTPWKPDPTMR